MTKLSFTTRSNRIRDKNVLSNKPKSKQWKRKRKVCIMNDRIILSLNKRKFCAYATYFVNKCHGKCDIIYRRAAFTIVMFYSWLKNVQIIFYF